MTDHDGSSLHDTRDTHHENGAQALQRPTDDIEEALRINRSAELVHRGREDAIELGHPLRTAPEDFDRLAVGAANLRTQLGSELLAQRLFGGRERQHHRHFIETLAELDAGDRRDVSQLDMRGTAHLSERGSTLRELRRGVITLGENAAVGEERNRDQEAAE